MRPLDFDQYVGAVTAAHVARAAARILGEPRSATCPLALALSDATSALWGVGRTRAWRRDAVKGAGARNHIRLPAWLSHRIHLYDNTNEMASFRFVLHWDPALDEWVIEMARGA